MHHDPSHIAADLECEAADHTGEKAPDAVADAEDDLGSQTQAEDPGEEGVAGQGGQVVEVRHGERTCLQRATVWVGDQGWRHPGRDGGGGGGGGGHCGVCVTGVDGGGSGFDMDREICLGH